MGERVQQTNVCVDNRRVLGVIVILKGLMMTTQGRLFSVYSVNMYLKKNLQAHASISPLLALVRQTLPRAHTHEHARPSNKRLSPVRKERRCTARNDTDTARVNVPCAATLNAKRRSEPWDPSGRGRRVVL